MCGWALSELRTSRADFASPKESAAVVLAPVMPAVCFKSIARLRWNDVRSYAASAVQAIRIATPHVITLIRVSFCPMDRLRRLCISSLAVLGGVVDDSRDRQKF